MTRQSPSPFAHSWKVNFSDAEPLDAHSVERSMSVSAPSPQSSLCLPGSSQPPAQSSPSKSAT